MVEKHALNVSRFLELLLAKIFPGRYIDLAPRYFDTSISARLNHTMKNIGLFFIGLFLSVTLALAGTTTFEPQPLPNPEEETSHDLFSYETTYTFRSDFKESKLGHVESLFNNFSYDHRFLITGRWYFRAGFEYERYDFGGTDNGLPDHLQAAMAHVAVEYIIKDHAGVGIEIDPGFYFQDNVTGDAFDFPWRIFVCMPLKKDKIFGIIGLGGALYQHPPVAPGGGIIWLISDKLRLLGIFPRPALIYEPNDDWDVRITGELNYTSFRTDDVLTTERKLQLHNAVVQYSENRAGAQVTYSGFKPFKISAGAGVTIAREFDFFRASQKKRIDPAPYIRIALEAKF